jgi:hypothetical protein
MSMAFKRELFAINSKRLLKQITTFVEEGFDSVEIHWASEIHRTSFVEVVEEWFDNELTDEVTHYKILCDDRNNTQTAFEKGEFNFEIQYKQKNCYNTSRITYHVTDKPEN